MIRYRARHRAAFTMLEVVVVLAVVGIVSALSAGRIHAIIVQQRVSRAATSLQTDIEAAFSIASRNRQPIRITWNAATMQMGVTDRAGTIYYRKTALGPDDFGLPSSGVSFSRSPLEVYPNGIANDALTIVLSIEGNSRTIQVSRTGLVHIQ